MVERLLVCCGLLLAISAQANDRPFQIARSAVMEDDQQVGSFESWAERRGSVRGLSVEPEYTFSDGYSLQFQLSRYGDTRGEQTGHETELEFKKVFNHIGRDGYGVALSASLGAERSRESGASRSLSLKLPISVMLAEGGPTLHLNPGLSKASASRRAWTSAIAIEHGVYKRTTAFAELAHQGPLRFAQIGARHWLRKDRLAIDIAWQQQRGSDGRASGLIVGLGWYDL